ncbi:hypothetical protein L6R53_30690 [Myxococcota bacterium]|nr:hypothetical protein [Myxococcota bacterium]
MSPLPLPSMFGSGVHLPGPLSALRPAARAARDQVLRAVMRRTSPPVEGGALDGGRGEHPLGAADLSFAPGPDLALADLGRAALDAGAGHAGGLTAVLDWIAADRPGQGAAWTDAGQVACRLVHLAAVQAWSPLDASAAATVGGSALAHARWLVRERPLDDQDPDATLAQAALVIAGLSWPALPGARDWTGNGMAALKSTTDGLVGPDGAPRSEPAAAARALWAVALARAWADANGMATPAPVLGALLRGATCLWRLVGDSPDLPASASAPPALLPLSSAPLSGTLRGLALCWGQDDGEGGVPADPAVQRLAARSPSPAVRAMAPDDEWRLWSWRSTGMAVAHARIKGCAGRGWFRQQDGRVQWDLDGLPLVTGNRAPARLVVARVDGPKARVIAVPPGIDTRADERPEREGWSLTPADKHEWTATQGDHTLVAKFDEEGWSWSVDGRRIVGVGDPAVAVRSMFELR